MESSEKRKEELERTANILAIEAALLTIPVGSEKCFKVDTQTWNRLRTRMHRLKINTGQRYGTSMDGDKVTITRIA